MSRSDDEAFYRTEKHIEALTLNIGRQLHSLPTLNSLDLQRDLILEIQNQLSDVSTCLLTLEQDARHYSYALKARAQKVISTHSGEVEQYQEQFQRFHQQISAGQLASLSHAEKVGRMAPTDQARYLNNRQVLLEGGRVLNESDQSLSNTVRVLAETEEIGAATSAKLVAQREQIQGTIDTVHETDDFLSKSKRTLVRMHRRLVTSKLLQGAIILTQMGAVGLIVWLKYYK